MKAVLQAYSTTKSAICCTPFSIDYSLKRWHCHFLDPCPSWLVESRSDGIWVSLVNIINLSLSSGTFKWSSGEVAFKETIFRAYWSIQLPSSFESLIPGQSSWESGGWTTPDVPGRHLNSWFLPIWLLEWVGDLVHEVLFSLHPVPQAGYLQESLGGFPSFCPPFLSVTRSPTPSLLN